MQRGGFSLAEKEGCGYRETGVKGGRRYFNSCSRAEQHPKGSLAACRSVSPAFSHAKAPLRRALCSPPVSQRRLPSGHGEAHCRRKCMHACTHLGAPRSLLPCKPEAAGPGQAGARLAARKDPPPGCAAPLPAAAPASSCCREKLAGESRALAEAGRRRGSDSGGEAAGTRARPASLGSARRFGTFARRGPAREAARAEGEGCGAQARDPRPAPLADASLPAAGLPRVRTAAAPPPQPLSFVFAKGERGLCKKCGLRAHAGISLQRGGGFCFAKKEEF